MARGAGAIAQGLPRWPGAAAAALVLALTLGTLAAVLWRAQGAGSLSSADWAALSFTLRQALVSALLSVLFAVPVARALARRSFPGRRLLIALLGAPFILPVIVAVLGLLAVFGRGGIVNATLGAVGVGPVSIYGFHGVVLAHVFFNLPLATRLILQGWAAIPGERFRLAASLGAPVGRLLEWPMLRAVVPGAFLVVFLICLSSFAVALTLGGGPRATTVELAIYQSLRFDFDPGGAAVLAALQFAICAVAGLAVRAASVPEAFGAGLDRPARHWQADGPVGRGLDALAITAAALFLLVPLGMVALRGVPGLAEMPASVWWAAARSIVVALCSAALTIGLALALAARGGWLSEIAGALPLAASSLVMGTGLFLVTFPFVGPERIALPVTVLVNAAMSLPFALRVLGPALERVEAGHGRLATALGIGGVARLRILLLPRMRGPLGFAAGLSAALSMGDLGVIALFAREGQATLPLAMYQLMGAYQMQAASGAALLLVGLAFGLFWLFDRGGRA